MPPTREEFCSALKAARERRGLKLTDIADVTKVCPSYFSALERNDLRVWPKGLFRRSFFRAYASTVGLPVAETLDEFLRLFPEDERAAAEAPANQCRLTLDESWRGSPVPVMTRLAAAVIDAAVVTLPAIVAAWITTVPFGMALAISAMSYFALATVLIAESPAGFCLRHRQHLVDAVASAVVPDQDEAAPEPEAGDDRPWVTDARRVRPRGQGPGLRVRFKVTS